MDRGDEEHPLVQETLNALRARTAGITTLEKMIALRSVPIFASLEPESLAALARPSNEESYAPDQILVMEGDPGDDAFIILSGSIRVVLKAGTANEVLVSERGAGDIMGEMAVLDPAPRSATLRAGAGGVRVLAISGTTLREALRTDPDVATGIIGTLVRRLRATLGRVESKQAA
jgi:CRP/FNR family transcriptional regulator